MRAISVSKSSNLGSVTDTLREVFSSRGMATSIRVHLFYHLFLITMSGQFAVVIIIIIIDHNNQLSNDFVVSTEIYLFVNYSFNLVVLTDNNQVLILLFVS